MTMVILCMNMKMEKIENFIKTFIDGFDVNS